MANSAIAASGHSVTQAGVASLPSSTSTVAVTLPSEEADTDYAINICPEYQTSIWYTNKATTGFTINVGTQDATYARNIDWSTHRF